MFNRPFYNNNNYQCLYNMSEFLSQYYTAAPSLMRLLQTKPADCKG